MKKFGYATLMWFVRLTWGILDTLIGLVAFLIFSFKIKKIRYIANTFVIQVDVGVGGEWGFEGGMFIFSNTPDIFDPTEFLYHEFGHTWPQLLPFGPLHPFVVCLPSMIRFWVRNWKAAHGKELPDYDSVWFEGTATRWGTKWFRQGVEKGLWNEASR